MRVALDRLLAADVLRRMPPEPRRRLKEALRALLEDPFPSNPKVDVRQLELDARREPIYRLKVGAWRAVYRVDSSRIQVVRIIRRDEGYAWLD